MKLELEECSHRIAFAGCFLTIFIALHCIAAHRSAAVLPAMNFAGVGIMANDDRSAVTAQQHEPVASNEAERIEVQDREAQDIENLQRDGYHAQLPGALQAETPIHANRDHDSSTASSSSATDFDGLQIQRTTSASGGSQSDAPTTMYLANDLHQQEKLEPQYSSIPFLGASHDNDNKSAVPPSTSTSNDGAIQKLARQASRLSTTSNRTLSDDPFTNASNDPRLDPTSPKFSARAYTQAVLKVHAKDRNAVPIRRAGVAFKNLTASGIGADTDFQKTIFNAPLAIVPMLRGLFGKQGSEIKILDNFAGLVRAGEMLVVLGPPGSGCSTFLKTIAGETHGFSVSEDSYINYQGIGPKQMHTQFRGEAIYTAEVEVHFPSLTVGQTLAFAAEARAPRKPLSGLTRRQYAEHARDVIMAVSNVVALLNIGTDYLRI